MALQHSDFATMLAHDLRSPLTAASEALSLSERSHPEDAREFQQLARLNLRRAQEIIAGFESLAAVRNDQESARLVDMDACVGNLLRELSPSVSDRCGSRESRIVNELGAVRSHEARVSTVFRNLISNAIEHNAGNENLVIRVGRSEVDSSTFYVEDNGAGVPKTLERNLFEPFVRHERIGNPGSGLGLWIVRTLMEEIGGSVRLEPAARRGALFFVTFPGAVEAQSQSGNTS